MRPLPASLFALFAAPLLAEETSAPALPGVADATRVTAGSYEVDARHTQVNWQVNHFGFNDYFNLALTSDVYTKGSYTLDAATIYKKRYPTRPKFSIGW